MRVAKRIVTQMLTSMQKMLNRHNAIDYQLYTSYTL
jgi:hypothetical protein